MLRRGRRETEGRCPQRREIVVQVAGLDVRLQLHPLLERESVERVGAGELADVVAVHPRPSIPSAARSFSIARRNRLFTGPSGAPVASEIWTCVSPSK